MTAPKPTNQPISINRVLVPQRAGIDPTYDGPPDSWDAYERSGPSDAQIAAINRVIDGSSDPQGALRCILGTYPSFPRTEAITASENAPVPFLVRQTPSPHSDRFAANHKPYTLSIPEEAMYGEAKRLAHAMQSPLGPAYVSLLAIHAGSGINLHDRDPKFRPTMFGVVLAPPGVGKTIVMDRARRVLRDGYDSHGAPCESNVETATSVSDRGILSTFRQGLEKNDPPAPEPTAKTLMLDEFLLLLEKMRIKGSSLQPMMCQLWGKDRVGVADKFGKVEINARVSMIGALALADVDDFQTRFAAGTNEGFYSRIIFAPSHPRWEFDWSWEPPAQEYDIEFAVPMNLPSRSVTMPAARIRQAEAWDDELRAKGLRPVRILEIAFRTAIISASLNGDAEVTESCMTAALAFAGWQLAVRGVYISGEGDDKDSIFSGVLLDAFRTAEDAHAEGKGKRVAGKPVVDNLGYVNFRLLQQASNWSRKYGATTVNRVLKSMVDCGQITHLIIREQGQPNQRTNRYRLNRGEED